MGDAAMRVPVMCRFTPHQLQAIRAIAETDDRSVAWVVRHAVDQYLASYDGEVTP